MNKIAPKILEAIGLIDPEPYDHGHEEQWDYKDDQEPATEYLDQGFYPPENSYFQDHLKNHAVPPFMNTTRDPETSSSRAKFDNKMPTVLNAHDSPEIIILDIREFKEAKKILTAIKNKKIVVVNLESMKTEEAQRIIDVTAGGISIVDGSVEYISDNIFLFAPYFIKILFHEEFNVEGHIRMNESYTNRQAS